MTELVKTCRCGRGYSAAEWAELRLVGLQPAADGRALEMRDCACGSTLCVDAPAALSCPHCSRTYTETQWQCLPWLQYAGGVHSSGVLVAVEVRRCNCSQPVGREVVVPVVSLRRAG